MLEIQEIQRLEKLYEEYKKKNKPNPLKFLITGKNSKFLVIEIFAIIVLLIILIFLSTKKENKQSLAPVAIEKNLTVTPPKTKEQNLTILEINTSKNALENGKQKSEQAKERFEAEKKQDELAEKIAKKLEQSIKLNEEKKEQESTKKQRAGGGWLKLNMPSDDENVQNEQSYAQPLPSEETIELEPKTKPKIDIQISNANDEISILKDKFNKNKNVKNALDIAKKCYEEKRYGDAIKWALTANDIDSSSEESWIIFAKAKYMLKQKDDALRALMEYNKKINKPVINELIKKIKSDTL